MTIKPIQVKEIPIKDLSLLERNPRKITKDQMDKLCKSIESDPDFLYNRPVLVNEIDGKLTVYAGNQRVKAADKLGWKQIPCIVEHNLSEEKVNKRLILDNRTMGTFDYDLLANEFDLDMLIDAGFKDSDFDMGDIEEVLSDQNKPKKKKTKTCPNCQYEF